MAPAKDSDKNIWEAIAEDNIKLVMSQIEAKQFEATSQDENGYTPIMAAVSYGRTEMLEYLLTSLPDDESRKKAVLMRDVEEDTAYHHFAMSAGDLDSDKIREQILAVLKRFFPEDIVEMRNAEDQSPFDISLEFDEDGRAWFFKAHNMLMPKIEYVEGETDKHGNLVHETIPEGDEEEE